ncbi:MAG: alpha/beta hydrolase-fold protein [Ilumatobacteraceae bacterium]
MALEQVATFPGTDVIEHFEIDSTETGARYAVAVVLPAAYLFGETVPVIYLPDGNMAINRLHGVATSHMRVSDEANAPVQPSIQVMIGYPADQVPYMMALRNRDLMPPSEPYSDRYDAFLAKHIPLDSSAFPPDIKEPYFRHLRNGSNDRFQAFIEKELHPEIADRYRVRDDAVGLFGYSFGGLFVLSAFSRGSEVITRFGAGSPGILVPDSRVHSLYADRVERSIAPTRPQHLHVTINDHELVGPTALYRAMGIEVMRFIDTMQTRPIDGVALTTRIVLDHDHVTGTHTAYESYLRTCYPAD